MGKEEVGLKNNIVGIDRTEDQSRYQQQFGYDLVQRLIRDQGPYGEQQFEYDSVGNRLSQVQLNHNSAKTQRKDYHYAPASNRLLSINYNALLLDSDDHPQGDSLAEHGAQSDYRYNAQNRISEYHENGQLKARYHYNALGQRIHKAVIQPDGTQQHTLFHYGLQGELLGETQLHANQPGPSQNIVWLQNRPVAALDSSEQDATAQIAWLHSDHLLTARAATDASQNLIWRWHSDAFGVGEAESLTSASNPEAQGLTLNLRFPGQYHDNESGLYYNYFRTYDPSMGRYTQSDPIGLLGGINTFAYVEGSPVQWADPLGLRALTVGEIELAKTIFGDKIDYSTVDIFRERFAGVIPVPAQRAMAPNGNIYFHPNNRYYSDDFSGASMDLKGLFIHEMTHVWQHQHGVNLWVRGAFERGYGYEINCNSTLSDYGIEAQGNIVMDYFFTLHGYKTASWGSQTYEGVYRLEDYKSVLSGYF